MRMEQGHDSRDFTPIVVDAVVVIVVVSFFSILFPLENLYYLRTTTYIPLPRGNSIESTNS